MKDKGYYGIGIQNGKTEVNFGTLFRTAQIFDADFLFLIGSRFKKMSSDTMASWKHIPVFSYPDFQTFNEHRPFSCPLIGIELNPAASELKHFVHPKSACYILGSEDNGLSKEAIAACQHLIVLPGKRSLNVAVAGSIVLYDRITKSASK